MELARAIASLNNPLELQRGLENYGKGVVAGRPGTLGDSAALVDALMLAFRPGVVQFRDNPITTDAIGKKMGADTESLPFIFGSMGLPGIEDVAKTAPLLKAIFAGARSLQNLGDAEVMTSHGLKGATQLYKDMGDAARMAKKGEDPWDKTGWFQGADGKWRYEIDDSTSDINKLIKDGSVSDWSLGALGIDAKETFPHEYLYAAYPEIAKIPTAGKMRGGIGDLISALNGKKSSGLRGAYSDEGILLTSTPEEAKSVMLHELTHGVQSKEGFARGGAHEEFVNQAQANNLKIDNINSELGPLAREIDAARASGDMKRVKELEDDYAWYMKQKMDMIGKTDPYDMYRSLAGEVEARNVQTRAEFTPEQRKRSNPIGTEDVDRERQIVRYK